jgi:hypothetical protein
MNHAQKTGTLFEIKNGNIVLPGAANKPQRKLADQMLCNSPVNRSQNFKSKF